MTVPTVYKPGRSGRVQIHSLPWFALPYVTSRVKLRQDGDALWSVRRADFDDVVRAVAEVCEACYALQRYGTKSNPCNENCWGAVTKECTCSCLGAYHGDGRLFFAYGTYGGDMEWAEERVDWWWVTAEDLARKPKHRREKEAA